VIALENVSARAAGASLAAMSIAWGAGVHTMVGAPGDGGPFILALLAGLARPRSGRVRVLDGDPADPVARRRIGHVPLEARLPDGLRAGEALELAAIIRGEPARSASERLAVLGVEALALRPVRSLSPEEARAVALAEVVTSHAQALLVEEPFVSLDPRAAAHVARALRERASAGAAVLVATASVRDAGQLGEDHTLLRSGAIAGRVASLDALAQFSPYGARVRLHTTDPVALATALAREAAVDAVARKDGTSPAVPARGPHPGMGAVVARGRDAAALAQAAARAVVASGVEVTLMRFEPPSLEEARAAAAGVGAATYQLAFERTRAAAAQPAPVATPPASEAPP
jgi:ABC-type multidrug transport system ATPase subunit